MKLGLIQTKQNELYDFAKEQLWFTKDEVLKYRSEMEEQTIKLIKEACQMGCDMIVTSEAVNFCGPQRAMDCEYSEIIQEVSHELFTKVRELAANYQTYIVLGAYNKREENLYNSAFVYNQKGKLSYQYDKIHLAGSENESLTPGEDYVIMETEFGKIGLAICWDMQFPESCRELVLGGAELIICPTWGWEQIYGHARAYENGIYVASAMSVPFEGEITGIRNPSEVISPEGRVLARGSSCNAEVVVCDFDMRDCRDIREMRLSNRHPKTYQRINRI